MTKVIISTARVYSPARHHGFGSVYGSLDARGALVIVVAALAIAGSISCLSGPPNGLSGCSPGEYGLDGECREVCTSTCEPGYHCDPELGVCLPGEDDGIGDNIPTGEITGSLCNHLTGAPLANISVSLERNDETLLTTTSSADGAFGFSTVEQGDYVLNIDAGPGDSIRESITVKDNETVSYNAPSCNQDTHGGIVGWVCDALGAVSTGTLVRLQVTQESSLRIATTDFEGGYSFSWVPAGRHEITFGSVGIGPLPVTVVGQQILGASTDSCEGCPTGFEDCAGICISSQSDAGNCGGCGIVCGSGESCEAGQCGSAPRTVTGVACIGIDTPHPLSQATVQLTSNQGTRETITGTDGVFLFADLPEGPLSVTISRSGWTTSFTIDADSATLIDVGTSHCVGAGRQIALVAGSPGAYDPLDGAFAGLGLASIVDSYTTQDWITSLASDVGSLAQYDAVFLSSGLDMTALPDSSVCGLPPQTLCPDHPGSIALANLEAYLEQGGIVYVSDWSYEVVRLQFPLGEVINFFRNDTESYRALCGAPQTAHAAIEQPILDALGMVSGETLPIGFLPTQAHWAVVVDDSSMQPQGQRSLVLANVQVYDAPALENCDASQHPTTNLIARLAVEVPVGSQGGRLIFSSIAYTSSGNLICSCGGTDCPCRNNEVIEQIIAGL